MNKLIIISICILMLVTLAYSQTVQTPSNVSISNDGYNRVTIDTIGGKKALDVNVIQSVSSSGVGTGILVSKATLTSTATLITTGANARSVMVRNTSAVDIYIGNVGVTTLTGMLVKADEAIVLDKTIADIYGVITSGTATVNYLKEY